MTSHQPAKPGGHRHCGGGDMILGCHVTSQIKGPTTVIKGSYYFMERSP